MLALAAFASIISWVVEMLTAALLGIVLDVVLDTGTRQLFAEQGFF